MLDKEEVNSPHLEELMGHYRGIISLLGEDAQREGLLKTPERVAKAMLTLTKVTMNPHFESTELCQVQRRIQPDGDCERHGLLLALRTPHVAFLRQSACGLYSNGYITGLSKIARVVDIFSHRLQVQERMTLQIKECIQQTLRPARGDGRR